VALQRERARQGDHRLARRLAAPNYSLNYSLVIPTYNRPEDLGRLLRFLAFQKAPFPVFVLDSSRPEVHERNVASSRGLALDLRLEHFDPAMPPWEKFRRGAEMIQTEFGSLCADDDLVLVPAIGRIVEFLAAEPGYAVAHGWYFHFYLSGALGLSRIACRSPSIDAAQPVDRLRQLFSNYEALTYGVHRTSVLRDLMTRVQGVQSMLGRELLGGALSVVAGKAARLPILYSGRSLGPSAPYADWHPVDFLASSPQSLFDDYQRYRTILLEYCATIGRPLDDAGRDLVDLAHLRYLSDYFKPAVIDYVQDQLRLGRSRKEIIGGVWPVLAEHKGLEGALHRSQMLRRLRDRFAPWLRGYHVRKLTRAHQYRRLSGALASGATREYQVHREFEAALQEGQLGVRPDELPGILAGYE
jgi:glycosyltransferase domain-containing protein